MISVAVMLVHRCLRLMLSDVWTLSCLHHFLLEFLGTALFLSVGLSSVLIFPPAAGNLQPGLKNDGNQSISEQITLSNHDHLTPQHPSCLQVALVFGLSVALASFCVGGEVALNPVVTVAMALSLRLRLWRATLYVIGQLLGGVASTALLLALTGDVTPALNKVAPGVQLHLAVVVETLATFQLVLVVLATINTHLPTAMSYLLIGMSVSLGHLMAVSTTGCGMNPARSFGPAVATLDFTNQWVFWAGPSLGACLSVLLNDLLLRPRWHHPKDWWAELKGLYVMTDKQQQVALSHCQ